MKVTALILSILVIYTYQGTCESKLPAYNNQLDLAPSGVASCSSLKTNSDAKGYSNLCCYLSFEYEQVEDDDNPLEYTGCYEIGYGIYLNDTIDDYIDIIESGTLYSNNAIDTLGTTFPKMCNKWEDRCSDVEIDCSSNYLKLSVLFLIALLL